MWNTYVEPNKGGEEAFNALWTCWMAKFSIETKQLIVAYALEKYGGKKNRAYEFQAKLRKRARDNRDQG